MWRTLSHTNSDISCMRAPIAHSGRARPRNSTGARPRVARAWLPVATVRARVELARALNVRARA